MSNTHKILIGLVVIVLLVVFKIPKPSEDRIDISTTEDGPGTDDMTSVERSLIDFRGVDTSNLPPPYRLAWTSKSKIGTSTQAVPPHDTPVYLTQEEEYSSRYWIIRASYPQIRELNNRTVEDEVNKNIKKFIHDQISLNTETEQIIGGYEQALCNTKDPPASCVGTSDINSRVSILTPRYLSMNIGIYEMGMLGNHPNHSGVSLNYDLQNGTRLTLGNLFKPDSDYLSVISDKVTHDLREQLQWAADDDMLKEGAGPAEKNFADFILTKTGLSFTFDDYQVASYAAGNPGVDIPYEELVGILDPKFAEQIPTFSSGTKR